jgi:TrmH family RNA methyltransferase
MKKITSRDNPTFKQLRVLAGSSRERRSQRRTLLDGMHLAESYVACHGAPELLVVSEGGTRDGEITRFVDRCPQVPVVQLADALFGEVSPVSTPTGILAVIQIPAAGISKTRDGSCVLLDAIQDAGNLGSILRSAAAAGVSDAHLGSGCAQAWSPRVLRAAMGAHFSLNINEHADLAAVLRVFPGVSVSTSLRGNEELFALDLTGPVAWLFGNEGAGLSPELAALASHTARIPMPGGTESLNVAAAAAVCLFEELRQKRAKSVRASIPLGKQPADLPK